MTQLGLSSTALFALGIAEHSEADFELKTDILKNELLRRKPDEFRFEKKQAQEEAIILAVAKMIEANNAELLKQLKSVGVLSDQ